MEKKKCTAIMAKTIFAKGFACSQEGNVSLHFFPGPSYGDYFLFIVADKIAVSKNSYFFWPPPQRRATRLLL